MTLRGTKVLVTAVQGTTLIVWPVDGVLPTDAQLELGEGPSLDNEQEPP